MKLVFMGSPDFAVPALNALIKKNWEITAVVTQPDRPKGRGRKLHPPPVKSFALKNNLIVLQPETVNSGDFVSKLKEMEPDFLIVTAFGQILSKEVLDIPGFMTLNIHPSLLPALRGPAPLQWAVINGLKETGVTIMKLDTGMDTGDIVLQEKFPIKEHDNSESLGNRLAEKGADLLISAIEKIAENKITLTPQDNSKATIAPLLKKADGEIDWTEEASSLDCFIRGMHPWPGAFTYIKGRRTRIFQAEVWPEPSSKQPGEVIAGTKDILLVATGKGVLSITSLQSSSGKQLKAADYLRGAPISPGTFLGRDK